MQQPRPACDMRKAHKKSCNQTQKLDSVIQCQKVHFNIRDFKINKVNLEGILAILKHILGQFLQKTILTDTPS